MNTAYRFHPRHAAGSPRWVRFGIRLAIAAVGVALMVGVCCALGRLIGGAL